MGTLGNTPRNLTVLSLEARKSYAFGLNFKTADTKTPVDLTGATVRLVVAQPAHKGGAVLLTETATHLDSELGLVQFELQAADLDLAENEYPFAVTLVSANGYSTPVMKGVLDVRASPDLDDSNVYAGINPSTQLAAYLNSGDVVEVRVDKVDGMAVIVQTLIADFTLDMDAKVVTAGDHASAALVSRNQAANSAAIAGDHADVAAAEADAAAESASLAGTKATEATTAANQAVAQAQAANTSATSASASATSATASKNAAATSASNAAASESAAAASATAAAASEDAVATDAADAANSATAAAASEQAAATSETNAAASATSATASKNAAATSATNAANSATSAGTSATAADGSADAAANSATAADGSADAAATSASQASTSASQASTSATNAANSATSATASKNAAATSETNAAASETAAATSETNAAASATSATASKNAAATSATNAATSETNAASSATSANSSKNAAATSETNAAASASAAATSASNAATSETNAAASEQAAAQSAADAEAIVTGDLDPVIAGEVNDPTSDTHAAVNNRIANTAPMAHTHDDRYFTETEADARFVLASTKGAANGVASLDASGKIPNAQIPALAISDTFPVASQAAMLALTAQPGDVAIRSDLSKSFILRAEPASTLANWSELLTPADSVTSVAGKTGVVSLVKGDVGLGSADNTSDANKPVSTAQQAALDGKVPNARTVSAGTGLTGGGDLSANRSLAVDFAASGTSSTTKAVRADDSRLSNARPPTAHSHSTSEVSGLDAALAAKAPTANPTFTGTATFQGTTVVGDGDQDVEEARAVRVETHGRDITVGYTGDDITTITEKDGTTTVRTVTLTYSGGVLESVTEVAAGKTITTDLVYTGEDLTAVNRSVV